MLACHNLLYPAEMQKSLSGQSSGAASCFDSTFPLRKSYLSTRGFPCSYLLVNHLTLLTVSGNTLLPALSHTLHILSGLGAFTHYSVCLKCPYLISHLTNIN